MDLLSFLRDFFKLFKIGVKTVLGKITAVIVIVVYFMLQSGLVHFNNDVHGQPDPMEIQQNIDTRLNILSQDLDDLSMQNIQQDQINKELSDGIESLNKRMDTVESNESIKK